ncbi:Retrovirus-related Pol polyprotein from transposon 17.6 [Vitis vinifera]|uniref:Retrovirus-related Pol polyprotein from transposon 17.6 n=1 Tax=Vitis vinifera TaxID=29760 RepID=A0A438BMS8_VITVI|nr:Retrovirus-related Pol polyprotein from transposon 17.6 [Vitis vinifera]
MQVSFEVQRSELPYHLNHDWRNCSGESSVRLGSKCEFTTILCLQAIGTRNGLMQLTFGSMTLELNIFYMSKKLITPKIEEGLEEVCIIDTLVEEHCNKKMQEKLNESLGDLEEGLPEPSNLLVAPQALAHGVEIYIPRRESKCPVVISSSLTTPREVCLLEVLKRCKKAVGWQISDLKGISPLVLKLLQAGIIYPISNSHGLEGVIDYRNLNAVTRKNHFSLPFIDQVLERVLGHPFYCFLDGYSRLGAQLEKCHFMVQQGIILSHIISEKDIEVDKANVELIVKLPSPTTVKGVRQFLGHAGFYKRFVKYFSKLSKPLCELFAKDVKFVWDERCQRSFEQLKQFLTTAPIVRASNWKLPFEVMCDANDFVIEVVLGQRKMESPM